MDRIVFKRYIIVFHLNTDYIYRQNDMIWIPHKLIAGLLGLVILPPTDSAVRPIRGQSIVHGSLTRFVVVHPQERLFIYIGNYRVDEIQDNVEEIYHQEI